MIFCCSEVHERNKRLKSDKKVEPLPKEYKTISLEYWPFSKDQNTIPYIEPGVNFSGCKIPYDTDGMLKAQIVSYRK